MSEDEEKELREVCSTNFHYTLNYGWNERNVRYEAILMEHSKVLLEDEARHHGPSYLEADLYDLIDRANAVPKLLKFIDGLRAQRDSLRLKNLNDEEDPLSDAWLREHAV